MNTAEALVNLVVTTIGVLLALLLTVFISRRSDDGVYHAIKRSVEFEANVNKSTLERSFMEYVRKNRGLVLNEFRLDVALNSLANPIFLRRTKPTQIEALNKYVRHLSHANNYARMARQFATASASDVAELWEDLYKAWDDNLNDCSASIAKILDAQQHRA
jgi:hypothetical protein